jgi:hypothetical protein
VIVAMTSVSVTPTEVTGANERLVIKMTDELEVGSTGMIMVVVTVATPV